MPGPGGGGVWSGGGGCGAWSGGSASGACLLPGGLPLGVSAPGGVPGWGVLAPRGGSGHPSMH